MFTAEDWNGIQEIARSRKRDDPLKVGRFGIGFNSVYHITGDGFLEMQITMHYVNYPGAMYVMYVTNVYL